MTVETLIIAGVVAFFGVFAVTLLVVSVWASLGPPRPEARRVAESVPAKRPDGALEAPHAPQA